jgi:hypothetical protein
VAEYPQAPPRQTRGSRPPVVDLEASNGGAKALRPLLTLEEKHLRIWIHETVFAGEKNFLHPHPFVFLFFPSKTKAYFLKMVSQSSDM